MYTYTYLLISACVFVEQGGRMGVVNMGVIVFVPPSKRSICSASWLGEKPHAGGTWETGAAAGVEDGKMGR